MMVVFAVAVVVIVVSIHDGCCFMSCVDKEVLLGRFKDVILFDDVLSRIFGSVVESYSCKRY